MDCRQPEENQAPLLLRMLLPRIVMLGHLTEADLAKLGASSLQLLCQLVDERQLLDEGRQRVAPAWAPAAPAARAPPLGAVLATIRAELESRKLKPMPRRSTSWIGFCMKIVALPCAGSDCCSSAQIRDHFRTTVSGLGAEREEPLPASTGLGLTKAALCNYVALQQLLCVVGAMSDRELASLACRIDGIRCSLDPAGIVPDSLLARAINTIGRELGRREAAVVRDARVLALRTHIDLQLAEERLRSVSAKVVALDQERLALDQERQALLAQGGAAARAMCAAAALRRRVGHELATACDALERATTPLSPTAEFVRGCWGRTLEVVVDATLDEAERKAKAAIAEEAEKRAAGVAWGNWLSALVIPLPELTDAFHNWQTGCLPEFPVLAALLHMCQHAGEYLKAPAEVPWLGRLVEEAREAWEGEPPSGTLLEALTTSLDTPLGTSLVGVLAGAISGGTFDAAADT